MEELSLSWWEMDGRVVIKSSRGREPSSEENRIRDVDLLVDGRLMG